MPGGESDEDGKRHGRRRVERDEEDIELLVEFLDESYDEVDRCEEILNDIQDGTVDPEYVNELFSKGSLHQRGGKLL